MNPHQMINHLILAWERSASFHLAPVAPIDGAPKARVAYVVHGSVVSAQLVSSTEGCTLAGRDVADVSARSARPVRGSRNVRFVLEIGGRGIGREVWRVSVDDDVAGLGEVDDLGFDEERADGFEVHRSMGDVEVWPDDSSASLISCLCRVVRA